MQYYCEKCKLVFEENYCTSCGDKNLRVPKNNDFCFLTEADSMFGEIFEGILDDENIPYVFVPSGSGVRSVFAI